MQCVLHKGLVFRIQETLLHVLIILECIANAFFIYIVYVFLLCVFSKDLFIQKAVLQRAIFHPLVHSPDGQSPMSTWVQEPKHTAVLYPGAFRRELD